MTITRRQAVGRMTAAAAGVALGRNESRAYADPLGMPVGFQCYDARFLLMKDWDEGWATMRAMNYQSVDLVSFKGYGYEKSSLGILSGRAVRDKLDSIGMQFENCQFYFTELHDRFAETIQYCHDLQHLKTVICAPESSRLKTVDDFKWQAEKLNELARRLQPEGLHLGYHNHDVEFRDIDGVTPYDVLMAHTDPDLVSFQIDVGNLTFAGKDALSYLKKYPKRYFSMHAKDYKEGLTSVPVGQGSLDWRAIFTQVKKTSIRNYFAEVAAYGIGTVHGAAPVPWPTDSVDQLRQSAVYLHGLHV